MLGQEARQAGCGGALCVDTFCCLIYISSGTSHRCSRKALLSQTQPCTWSQVPSFLISPYTSECPSIADSPPAHKASGRQPLLLSLGTQWHLILSFLPLTISSWGKNLTLYICFANLTYIHKMAFENKVKDQTLVSSDFTPTT